MKVVILVALCALVAGAVALKQAKAPVESREFAAAGAAGGTFDASKVALPLLVDLGAGKCIPCKKMAPILEELKKEYAGRMEVEFIDVWKNPDALALTKLDPPVLTSDNPFDRRRGGISFPGRGFLVPRREIPSRQRAG